MAGQDHLINPKGRIPYLVGNQTPGMPQSDCYLRVSDVLNPKDVIEKLEIAALRDGHIFQAEHDQLVPA